MPKYDLVRNPLAQSQSAIQLAASKAINYLENLPTRCVAPTKHALTNLQALQEDLPTNASDPLETIELLDRLGSPTTVATAAGRFFGLVVGGSLPATVGSRILNAAWDQVATTEATSPISIELEKIAAAWVLEILGLPRNSSVGFVSGTTIGNLVCLCAARHALLARQGWDVERQGLFGAPPLHIVVSQEIHITVKKVLSILGLGSDKIHQVECDSNGAMRPDKLPQLSENSLILSQAGNVNSGAFDPINEIADKANEVGAWLHVDGAFGLWVAASSEKKYLLRGIEKADSWVTDGHKWLNTPYDCGMAICKHPQKVHNAMSTVAPYLNLGAVVAPKDMVPELSRSARGIDIWAALRSLGREGVENLIDRCCRHAQIMGNALDEMGFTILNDIVINQIVATLPKHEDKMTLLAEQVVLSGKTWFGPTRWRGKDAFRISFSSWVTSDDDVAIAISCIKRVATDMSLLPQRDGT